VKNFNLFKSFRGRKFQYGGFAALAALAAVLLAITVNLLVEQIPLRLDLTQKKIFSLSEETQKLLASLDREIRIYHVLKTESEDPQVREVLRRYGAAADRLVIETVDPELNPGWAKQFESDETALREGTLVVSAGKRFKVITRMDMYNLSYSDSGAPPTIQSLALEQRITSAIQYVLSPRNTTVYTLQGHGEESLASLRLQRILENLNYDVKELNLLTLREVPAEVDVLAILNPTNDLSNPDLEKLLAYMDRGGRLLVATDPMEFPNLSELLKAYGIAIRPLLVVESLDTSFTGNPFMLLPALELHEITKSLRSNDMAVLFPFAQAIERTELKKKNIRHERLVFSTRDSYGKSAFGNLASLEKLRTDPEGPFTLAVAVTDPEGEGRPQETRLVAIGSYRFFTQPFFTTTPGNSELFVNSINWLANREEALIIQPKDLVRFPLVMSNREKTLWALLVVFLMPLAAFTSGFLVWIKRRHR